MVTNMNIKLSWLPNAISIIRLLLIIPYSILFFSAHNYALAFLAVLIILTDKLDGFLARKLKCESNLGELLDSIADGVFVLLTWFLFYLKGLYGMPLLIILLLPRPLIGVSILARKFIHKKWHAKHFIGNRTATVANYIAILWLILKLPYEMHILTVMVIANYALILLTEITRHDSIKYL